MLQKFSNALITALIALTFSGQGYAGTTTIDFSQGLTQLEVSRHFNLVEITDDCNLYFQGQGLCSLTDGATPQRVADVTGAISVTIGLNPAVDAGGFRSVVLQLYIRGGYIVAYIEDDGTVNLVNLFHNVPHTIAFDEPNAPDGTVTLSFDTTTSIATVSASGTTETASLPPDPNLLDKPVNISVWSDGGSSIRSISATGDGLPEIDATGECGATTEGEDPPTVRVLGGGMVEDSEPLRLYVQPDPGYASYQWRKNGTPLWEETGPALVRDPFLAADAGEYDVVVGTGAKAVLTSEPTVVSLVPANSLPVGGALALSLLTGALALAAARRK